MNVASPLCSTLFICSLNQLPPRARTFCPWTKKCTHGGYHLECPFGHVIPRDASPPVSSLGELCKTRGSPSFGSFRPVQSSCEVPASTRALLRAYYGPGGHAIHPVEPSHGKGLLNRPVPSNLERRPHPFGQVAPVGPSDCSYPRSRGASTQNDG